MPIIKTEQLAAGPQLDAAVALALGYSLAPDRGLLGFTSWITPKGVQLMYLFEPSSNPAHGAPLIWERKIATFAYGDRWCAVDPVAGDEHSFYNTKVGFIDCYADDEGTMMGETALVAGCRLLVKMALGNTITIPDGLEA